MELKDLENWITRKYMREIVEKDTNLYYKDSRFNLSKEDYIKLLLNSIDKWDINSFTNDLLKHVKSTDDRGYKVPSDAHMVLGYWEFNRYYISSVLRQAMEKKLSVKVYRFREVDVPRVESENMIWNIINWEELNSILNNLLSSEERIRFSSEFCKPNSWITVMLIK